MEIMGNSKLVSVIMSVYNPKNEAQLIEAIESILGQTHRNLELIICNDGSSENIEKIIRSYAAQDSRIIQINNKVNMGLAASLNNCLEVAKGGYIARQDDDDISKNYRIEKELKFLETHPEYDFVGCAVELFDKRGKWGQSSTISIPDKEDFLRRSPFAHPTILVRKDAYDRVNGYRISKETKRAQDYDMFMRMYSKGLKGYNISECLYEYWQDENSYKKVKFKYKLDEVIIRYKGFKLLRLYPKGYMYLFKPIISGLTPIRLKKIINKYRYQ